MEDSSFFDRPIHGGVAKKLLDTLDPMSESDIGQVVTIHIREIGDGIFTELGPDFLRLFYRHVIASPFAMGYVVKKDGKILGFIAGTNDAGMFLKQLFRRFFLQTGWIVCKRAITQPVFLPLLLKRVAMNRNKGRCAESLAGAVLKEYQQCGYGVILLKKIIDDLRATGIERIHCDVVEDAGNATVVKLHQMYRRGGYVPVKSFHVGPVKYIRYQRSLVLKENGRDENSTGPHM